MGWENNEIWQCFLISYLSIDFRNGSGLTPMACAAEKGHDKIIKLLIGAKAKIDCVGENTSLAPLLLAAENGHSGAVDLLLKNNADVTVVNEKVENALDVAIENGHT